MARGQVKWFDQKKGYGFIAQEDGDDLFVHYSAIQKGGFKNLQEGDEVEFEISQDQRGAKASNVVVLK